MQVSEVNSICSKMQSQEQVILVDVHDNPLGVMEKMDAHVQGLSLIHI